jgi:hypothetical protein
MAHINDINNFNEININNLPVINNYLDEAQDNECEIQWVIDRRPDHNNINNINNINDINDINFINNLQNIRNHHFNDQFARVTHALMNGLIHFEQNEDFIPFEPQPIQAAVIETEVAEIPVSEEERDCPICYETREHEDITQLNCQHKFCTTCITEHIRTNRHEPRCPLCRENITHITFQSHQDNANFLEI